MNNYKQLIRVFNRDIAYEPPKDKIRRTQLKFLAAFSVIFIMIPVAVGSGLFTYLMTRSLVRAGHGEFGILLMYHLISIFTMVFGLNVVFNELYFSRDLERLLPLPLRGREIAAAKFTAAYRNENVIQFILILSCTVGYGLGAEMPVWRWPIAIVFGFLLSLVPMLFCAILGIFLMGFTRVIRSKTTVRRISVIFMLVVFALMGLALTTLKTLDVDSWIVNAASQEIPFIRIMNVVFAENYFLVMLMGEGNVLGILWFILLHAALIGIFLLVANRFYLDSVSRMGEDAHNKRRKAADVGSMLRARSPLKSCMVKEWRILHRTPVFLTHCVLITLIWPVFTLIAASMTGMGMSPSAIAERYKGGDSGFALGVMLFSGAISFIMGSMNSLGSNAFSREGGHFEVLKYLPVDIPTHWNAKGLLGTLITGLGTAPFFLFFGIYGGLPLHHTLLMVALSLAASFGITYLGLLLDSVNPKLAWEDALTALRENYNTFFCMAIAIGIAAVMVGIGILFYAVLGMPVGLIGLFFLVLIIGFDFLIYRRGMTRGVENILHVGE